MKPQSPALPLSESPASALSRTAILIYGVASYAIGVGGLCWLIAATLGLVPFTGGGVTIGATGAAIAFNLMFVVLFGVQHGIMARPSFKARWTKIIPEPMERPTFVLVTGVLVCAMMWFWQPFAGTVWAIDNAIVAAAMRGVAVLGWGYLLAASFAIDHFELFGLKQVWRNFTGSNPPKVPFVERFMYRFDRHPIMTGMLVGLWCTPVMRVDHLLLAAFLTTFIVIGVTIEERTLVALHGDDYREYRRNVGALVPLPGRRS
jgi:protein-S-isoprenylcysteine O-methyltransferase Ste14